jgi:hypothetical protein
VTSSGYVTRASSHALPTARSAGKRVEAADGASFVVFIFLGLDRPEILFPRLDCLRCWASSARATSGETMRKIGNLSPYRALLKPLYESDSSPNLNRLLKNNDCALFG